MKKLNVLFTLNLVLPMFSTAKAAFDYRRELCNMYSVYVVRSGTATRIEISDDPPEGASLFVVLPCGLPDTIKLAACREVG